MVVEPIEKRGAAVEQAPAIAKDWTPAGRVALKQKVLHELPRWYSPLAHFLFPSMVGLLVVAACIHWLRARHGTRAAHHSRHVPRLELHRVARAQAHASQAPPAHAHPLRTSHAHAPSALHRRHDGHQRLARAEHGAAAIVRRARDPVAAAAARRARAAARPAQHRAALHRDIDVLHARCTSGCTSRIICPTTASSGAGASSAGCAGITPTITTRATCSAGT